MSLLEVFEDNDLLMVRLTSASYNSVRKLIQMHTGREVHFVFFNDCGDVVVMDQPLGPLKSMLYPTSGWFFEVDVGSVVVFGRGGLVEFDGPAARMHFCDRYTLTSEEVALSTYQRWAAQQVPDPGVVSVRTDKSPAGEWQFVRAEDVVVGDVMYNGDIMHSGVRVVKRDCPYFVVQDDTGIQRSITLSTDSRTLYLVYRAREEEDPAAQALEAWVEARADREKAAGGVCEEALWISTDELRVGDVVLAGRFGWYAYDGKKVSEVPDLTVTKVGGPADALFLNGGGKDLRMTKSCFPSSIPIRRKCHV